MAKETQSQVSFDDIQVQNNLCYQINESTQSSQREPEKAKQSLAKNNDLQMHANPCYQHRHRVSYSDNRKYLRNIIHQNSMQVEHQTETEDENNNDLDSIKKCLYIMSLLTMVLFSMTLVVIILSVLTYTQLPKATHGEPKLQVSKWPTIIKNDTNSLQAQINEIHEEIPQALNQLNFTKNTVMALQVKLDEIKMNVSQVLLHVEEASTFIMNTSEVKFEKELTIQTQETQPENLQMHLYCGAGEWHRVALLNMSDPTENCPSAWGEYVSDGIRACIRPNSPEGSCSGIVYPLNNRPYSKVCGRVIGYQFGSPDAFSRGAGSRVQFTINQPYVDGVSITHGSPRNHIWSYAAGASEQQGSGSDCSPNTCPCSGGQQDLPSYVGNNYYCESAFLGNCYVVNTFFPNDPLWDGRQCDNEGTCCTGTNTPPWFSVDLSNPTSDDIEVRICHNQGSSDEDSPIELLELYVQ